MARILTSIIGSSGFIGRSIIANLIQEKCSVRAFYRDLDLNLLLSSDNVFGADITDKFDFTTTLRGSEILINAAGFAHQPNSNSAVSINKFRAVNVDAIINLASAAAEAGIKRMVHISTIKVNGEITKSDTFFHRASLPDPQNYYGKLKLEAEVGLQEVAARTGMELVIIRPPAVYGPRMKGNLASLVNLLKWNAPLPFGSICNKRSFIGIDNLVDLVITASRHPKAANKIYLASDGEDLSTPDLIKKIALALKINAKMFSLNPDLLISMARILGKAESAERLCYSLRIDHSAAMEDLGWRPRVSVDDGLMRAVNGVAV
jgi:nucleoside-diphosphate-sugar epimerase